MVEKGCKGQRDVKDRWRTILATILSLLLTIASCAQNAPRGGLTAAQQMELRTLSGQLSDPERSAKTKLEAASLLLSRSFPEAQVALAGFLKDNANRPAQIAVAEAIAVRGGGPENFVEPLMGMLKSGDASVRASAARAMGAYRNQGAGKRLVGLARDAAAQAPARLSAIDALSNFRDRPTVDALVGLLDDRQDRIRKAAAKALTKLTSIRTFGNDRARWKQWWRLNRAKPYSVWLADLAEGLAKAKTDLEAQNERLRDRLARAMMDLYAATPPAQRDSLLLGFMKDSVAEVREVAAVLLERKLAGGEEVSDELRAQVRSALADPDVRVRRHSALLVANLRDDEAVKTLLDRLKTEEAPTVRQALLVALGQLGAPEALPAVLAEVRSKDSGVAAAAARALGRLASRKPLKGKALSEASEALADRYKQVGPSGEADGEGASLREALLSAMGLLHDKSALPVLREALKDPTATVRLAGINALAAFRNGSADLIAPLAGDPDRGVRQAAIAALGALDGAKHLPTILARTNPSVEPDAAVRRQAWDVAMKTLAGSDETVLANVAKALAKRPDAKDQRIGVLGMLVTARKASKSPALPDALRALGLALRAAPRPAEAVPHLQQAYSLYAVAKRPEAGAVWHEWIDAMLDAEDPTVMKALAAQEDQGEFDKALARVLERLKSLSANQQWDAVVVLAGEAAKELATRLKPEQLKTLSKMKDQAAAKQLEGDRRRVEQLVGQLLENDEQARKASQALQAMGRRAVAPLLEELRKTIAATKPDANREKAILAVLAQVAPNLTGYDPTASNEVKIKQIDAWLEAL